MIDSKDISVIVQGAIDKKITLKCLKSIKKYLPKAEVILSTWEGSNVEKLKKYCDKIILNKDPGAYDMGLPDKPNSLNRMIFSTQQGLKFSNRKYTLKLRSDLILKNNNILKFVDNFKRINKYKLFKSRILANNVYTIKFEANENQTQKHYRPFHVSDWWFFGLTEDIKLLFDIPLAKEPDYSEYFIINKKPKDKFQRWTNLHWQFASEQYIQLACIKKYFSDIKIEHLLDYNDTNIQQSEIYIINNYHIMEPKKSGIYNIKHCYKYYDYRTDSSVKNAIYTDFIWLNDYKKYIDNSYKFNRIFKFTQEIMQEEKYRKLIKHKNCFMCLARELFTIPLKLVSEIIASIFYLFEIILLMFKKLLNIESKQKLINSSVDMSASNNINADKKDSSKIYTD